MMMVSADVMHRCGVSGIAEGDQQVQGQSRTHLDFSYRATTGSCVMCGMTVTGELEYAIKPTGSW
jgi:hypothetical protein